MAIFSQLSAIILPVLVCAGLGFTWARMRSPFDHEFVTRVVSMVGTPCLVAHSLISLHVDRKLLGEMAGATALVFCLMFALGLVVLRVMRLPNHSYLPAVVFSNSGNMGLPLALFAFGNSGLALAVVYFAISASLQFSLGISIAAGTANFARLLRVPVLYAVAGSLIVILTGVEPPQFIDNTLQILGGLTIPLMLMALGVSLADLKVTSLPRNLLLALVRLIGGFLASLLVAWLLNLAPDARGVLLIQASMPVAVFNFLFAKQFKRQPADVAAMVVISTLLSFISLPLLIYSILP
jgi:predicted permease